MDTQPVSPQPNPVVGREKTKSRPAVVVLSVFLLLALAATAILGYIAYEQSRTIQSAEMENERLSTLTSLPNNGQAQGGRDLIDESAINRATVDYMRALRSDGKNSISSIDYLDSDYKYARVSIKENFGKNEQGNSETGATLHTLIFKSLDNGDTADKTWIIVAVDPNSPEEKQRIQATFDVPTAVFTDNRPV